MNWLTRSVVLAATIFPASALACSQAPEQTFEKMFGDAPLVFRALVTETRLNAYVDPGMVVEQGSMGHGDARGRYLVDIKYEVLETFKGEPKPDGVITTTTAVMGGCGLPVLAGWQFLFVVAPFDKDAPKRVSEGSQGMVWVFSSEMLPDFKPRLDEALEEVRTLAKKK